MLGKLHIEIGGRDLTLMNLFENLIIVDVTGLAPGVDKDLPRETPPA